MGERNLHRSIASRVYLLALVLAVSGAACAKAPGFAGAEVDLWGAFRTVNEGPLGVGIARLPAPVRQAHCYRVILATDGVTPPQLRFQGELDAVSVGFPIHAIERRSTVAGTIAVFGFCSRGTGTVQLLANVPDGGYGVLLEAPFSALDPSQGQDVAATGQWLGEQQAQAAAQRAQAERERLRALAERFAQEAAPELRARVDELARGLGRYESYILDEVKGNENLREAMILDPGRCYLFAAVGHRSTEIRSQVEFSRIRNATQRVDEGGAIMYKVCTAPNGPIQEVTYVVEARVPPGSPHPPIFIARVAQRNPTPTEARAADDEWIRNDPEGQTGQ